MTDRNAFLASLAFFAGLPAPVLDAVAETARRQKWSAGTVLFQRGDPSDFLLFLETGRVKISLMNADGREFTLQHLRPGVILGEVGVLDESPRTADATAETETTAWVLDRRAFHDLMARHPELARAAIRHLCSLVRYTTDHIETIALYDLETRLARYLLSAVERQHSADVELDLSQGDIADLIGSSRPKVNQALMSLEQAGAIARNGKLIRCDVERLRRAAALDDIG